MAVLGSQPRGPSVKYDKLESDFLNTETQAGGAYVLDTADFPSFSSRASYVLVAAGNFSSEAQTRSYCGGLNVQFGCVAKSL